MFRKERPWLGVYEKGRVEPETQIFEDSLYELFRARSRSTVGRLR
jgi:hypothetical protein